MPIVALLTVPFLAVLVPTIIVPLSLVLRYRYGTSRSKARSWLAVIGVFGLLTSCGVFLATATVTSWWEPQTLPSAMLGLAGGGLLGLVGLAMSRWEPTQEGLFYTPNRWLVLGLTVLIAARVGYGFWRGLMRWRAVWEGGSLLAAFGVAGSLAAGGIVLGYYFVYTLGLWRRVRRHDRLVPAR